MSLADKVLSVNNDLPIRTNLPVHSGKVRSVYWLTEADSRRLIEENNYDVAPDSPLAIMVISDRISAFECIWKGEGNMQGVPGKVRRLMLSLIIGLSCSARITLRIAIFLISPIPLYGLFKKLSQ